MVSNCHCLIFFRSSSPLYEIQFALAWRGAVMCSGLFPEWLFQCLLYIWSSRLPASCLCTGFCQCRCGWEPGPCFGPSQIPRLHLVKDLMILPSLTQEPSLDFIFFCSHCYLTVLLKNPFQGGFLSSHDCHHWKINAYHKRVFLKITICWVIHRLFLSFVWPVGIIKACLWCCIR